VAHDVLDSVGFDQLLVGRKEDVRNPLIPAPAQAVVQGIVSTNLLNVRKQPHKSADLAGEPLGRIPRHDVPTPLSDTKGRQESPRHVPTRQGCHNEDIRPSTSFDVWWGIDDSHERKPLIRRIRRRVSRPKHESQRQNCSLESLGTGELVIRQDRAVRVVNVQRHARDSVDPLLASAKLRNVLGIKPREVVVSAILITALGAV
jgi:hypothetical protein